MIESLLILCAVTGAVLLYRQASAKEAARRREEARQRDLDYQARAAAEKAKWKAERIARGSRAIVEYAAALRSRPARAARVPG
jgi:hypothetical protein